MKQLLVLSKLAGTLGRSLMVLAGLFAVSARAGAQALPTTPPTGYDQSGQYTAGTTTTVSYYSPSQGSNDTLYIYTPPGYTSSKKYPVIYGYPGISAGADTIFDDWCVDAGIVADNLIGQGKIQPVIIVAIDDNNGDVASDTLNVIIPYIDSHYSTYADADHRGLYGYSWGGGYTFNIGCGNLNTFHYLNPCSAAPDKNADTSLFPNNGADAQQKLKLMLIACGNADWLGLFSPSQNTHYFCVSNNIPHAWWPVNGGGHDAGTVWRPAMWNFLQMADAAGFRYPPVPRVAFSQVEAENYDSQFGGVVPESCGDTGGGQDVGTITNGCYLVYHNVNFGLGETAFNARVASASSGGNIEVRLDSTNGTLLGTCAVAGTGGWQTWTTVSCAASGATGTHDLILKFTGGSGYLFNVNWWVFNTATLPSAPAAPTSVTATAGSESVSVKWLSASSALTYNVKRSAVSGGPYVTVATMAGTNYIDTGVFAGTAYYYAVSALNAGGESANSSVISAVPTNNTPSPWLSRDIGAGGLAGSASFTNGVFTLFGCGSDIGGAADQFRLVYATNTGDCAITTRVATLDTYINSSAKAGAMIRESLNTNAMNAFIGVTAGNGVVFQYRSSTGGGTVSSAASGVAAPVWVKLARTGNTFSGYYSANGSSWTLVGSATLSMASAEYVGVGISSHEFSTLCSATLDHVTAPGWAPALTTPPSGLTATAGVEKATLKWAASSNATSYYVKRASASGGSYTNVATVTATNYTDTGLVGGSTYYYVVSAVNSLSGESANSAEVSASPTLTVPSPWKTQDIGTVGLAGGASFVNGVFTLSGAGADIWNSSDAFRFAYATNSGNFTIIARVASLQNIDAWSKAGVMIRESLDAGAANAFVAVTPGNGVTWQYRTSSGGSTANSATSGLTAPYWVKLVRNGTNITGYRSADGSTWTQQGTMTNTASLVYIGLALTSHNTSSLATATFDNVSVPGWTNSVAPSAPASLTASAGNAKAVLTWTASSGATSYNVKRSTTSGGPYSTIASSVTGTSYTDTGLTNGAAWFYVVSAVNASGESVNSPQATAQPQVVAPLGVAATPVSTNQIQVSWTAFNSSATYTVKRSTVSGGPYATIATGVAATSYLDSGLASGMVYYYVVSAVVSGVETPNSDPAAAITPMPVIGNLLHRYPLTESGGASFADAAGGQAWAGTVYNSATLSGGRLVLASASQQYASLPAGIVANQSNCAVMAWLNVSSTSAGTRLFDFGSGTGAYMYLAVHGGGSGALGFGITTNGSGAEQQITTSRTIAAGTWHMVAVSLGGGVGVLYLDGYAVGTNASLTLTPASLGVTANNYLGRSQNNDLYLDGSINEFRVYNSALSANEVKAANVLGRGQQLSSESPQLSAGFDGSNLILSWPLAGAGFGVQSRPGLDEGTWTAENAAQLQIVDGQWQVILALTNNAGPAFFRLAK